MNVVFEFQSLNPKQLNSESAAILCAHHAGILTDIFNEQLALTVFGRMGMGEFQYEINDRLKQQRHTIQVKNAQCEIDGAFEGVENFCLVEAKNASASDFLVRQLYYPYRLWATKIKKPITPVFLTYSNDIFVVRAFRFKNVNWYNSLELVTERRYTLVNLQIELDDIIAIWKQIEAPVAESPITFPQADSFARVLDLLETMMHEPLWRDDVSVEYDIAERQVNY